MSQREWETTELRGCQKLANVSSPTLACPAQVGLASYLVLSLSYGLYALAPGWFSTFFVVFCSALAGAGGSLIWVAQSTHFAATAKAAGGPAPIAFASLFAFWYISLEGLVKISVATILYLTDDTVWIALALLFAVSALAYFALYYFPAACGFAPEGGYQRRTVRDLVDTVTTFDFAALTAVARAHFHDARIPLLSPQWLAFGFSSSVFTSWYCGLVSEKRNDAAVGFSSAVLSFVAGGASPLFGKLAHKSARNWNSTTADQTPSKKPLSLRHIDGGRLR